jgi:D-arabinose 1-dehydrogenase-like Zn-dependent alcohol dehydrogenase
MKKLFLLFSHRLTQTQEEEARSSFFIEDVVYLPEKLQYLWSEIPADLDSLSDYLTPLKNYLKNYAKKNDIVLIQGDFGATHHMVNFTKEKGLIAIYATTKREVKEHVKENKLVKESIFDFERFRVYE